nr:PIN domain-containing protein [Burkholderiales bacterium]
HLGELNHVVVCELLWVLDHAVGLSRAVLAETVECLLTSAQCEFESRDLLWRALTMFRTSKADFADCLIAAKNAAAGCDATATFDRRAAGVAGFTAL